MVKMNIQMAEKDYEQEWYIFLQKIDTYASDPAQKWTVLTLLSYFVNKYKVFNEIDFVFDHCKKGPTQSREMKAASKIWRMFDQGRYKQLTSKENKEAYKEQLVGVLKEYIDWAFSIKMRGKAVNITGLGLFAIPNFMNEFLQWRKTKRASLPRRNDPIPFTLMKWMQENIPTIFERQQLGVLDDLNALYNYVEAYNTIDSLESIAISKARELKIMPEEGKIELDKK